MGNIIKKRVVKKFPEAYIDDIGNSSLEAPESVGYKSNMQLAAVFGCINVPAETMATMSMGVYSIKEDGSHQRDRSHSLDYMISKRPWPTTSQHDFMVMMLVSMVTVGYAVAYIHKDQYGKKTGIEYIIPEEVALFANREQNDFRLKIARYPEKGYISPADVIFLKNFSWNGIEGESTLKFAQQATYLARSADKTAQDYFSSGGSISGYLKSKNALGSTRIKDLKFNWRKQFSRSKQTSGTEVPVLDNGLEFEPITVKPVDAQLLESRKFSAIEICQFFMVPPSKIFMGDNKYNSGEFEQISYIMSKIMPLTDKIEQEFSYKLISSKDRNKYEIKFDSSDLIKGDFKSMGEWYSKMIMNAVYKPDEVRNTLGLPVDPKEGGDIRWMMSNQIPMSLASDPEYWKKSADNKTVGGANEKDKENNNNQQNNNGETN